jgi:hypothetical protein
MNWTLAVSIIAVGVSAASAARTFVNERRLRHAEDIRNLLGDKETVTYGALKVIDDGLPGRRRSRRRSGLIQALMQAGLLEGSDRARAMVFRAIQLAQTEHNEEVCATYKRMKAHFDAIKPLGFAKKELNFKKTDRRLGAVSKLLGLEEDNQPAPAASHGE